MANEYYAEDLSAIPFRLQVSSFKQVMPAYMAYPIACYFRIRDLLGWRSLPRYAIGPPNSGVTVSRNECPARTMSRWAPILERLGDLGFRDLSFTIGDAIGARETARAIFLDPVGSTIATLVWLRMEGDGIEERSPLEFNSYGPSDPETMTGIVAEEHLILSDMFKVDFVDTLFVADRQRLERVYQQHLDRIRGRSHFVLTPELAIEEHNQRNQRRFEWALKNHLLRKLTAAEIEQVKQLRLPE